MGITVAACLLFFVFLGSTSDVPEPDLVVEQVLDELDALDLVGSSSHWSHRYISLKLNPKNVLKVKCHSLSKNVSSQQYLPEKCGQDYG